MHLSQYKIFTLRRGILEWLDAISPFPHFRIFLKYFLKKKSIYYLRETKYSNAFDCSLAIFIKLEIWLHSLSR